MISTLLFLYGIIGTGSHGDGGATLPLTNAVKINWDGLPDVVAQAIPTYLDQVNTVILFNCTIFTVTLMLTRLAAGERFVCG